MFDAKLLVSWGHSQQAGFGGQNAFWKLFALARLAAGSIANGRTRKRGGRREFPLHVGKGFR